MKSRTDSRSPMVSIVCSSPRGSSTAMSLGTEQGRERDVLGDYEVARLVWLDAMY